MKVRKPDYYDRFRCIAGACKDSCCIGWEIEVDPEKREYYQSVQGALGDRLKQCIDWEEGSFILQGKEERCPFLNHDGLCDLIIELGEESLCEICREHPRYHEWYAGLTETGIGLCCEEAARLVIEQEAPASWILTDGEEDLPAQPKEDENDEALAAMLFDARDTAFYILQNRKISIWDRLECFLLFVEEVQEALDFGNLEEIEESSVYYRNHEWEPEERAQSNLEFCLELIDVCKGLDPMDSHWPNVIEELKCMLKEESYMKLESAMIDAYSSREYEYEHLAVYFVFRYFMKARIDGDLYSKGKLAVFCVMLIHLLDVLTYKTSGRLSKADRAWNAKMCSKEVEYSEDNLETLAEIFWNRELLYKSW